MSSAIIGFGAIGQALARAFARKNIQVAVAGRRAPEAIAPQAKAIGPTVTASSLQDALKAQIVILAVPFGLQNELAKAADWRGKIVIDAEVAADDDGRRIDYLVSLAMHLMGIPGHTAYAASKAALRSYART
jgi:predicted dinucleotide-binding enzyme